jgi:Uma2 family endonuclease
MCRGNQEDSMKGGLVPSIKYRYNCYGQYAVAVGEFQMTASMPVLGSITLELGTLKRWTLQDYSRMSEMGLIDAGERTELIDGQILLMVAKGTPHVLALRLLSSALSDLLLGQAVFVSTQDPIELDNFSQPEPDLAIVYGTVLDYADRHPRSTDLVLVVEVADATLKTDCEMKDRLYARAGIADYWVLDLRNRQLHVFRNPTPTGYTSHLILNESNQIAPLLFPAINLEISAILPPVV